MNFEPSEYPLGAVFRDAMPFPHIVIDELVALSTVRAVNAEWPNAGWKWHQHEHSAKRACAFRPCFGPATAALIDELNSPEMVERLAMLSGIEGLRADRSLAGGGLHETFRGGFLDIHADFNLHPDSGLHRRLNLLLYLNEDWRADWAGYLQLWGRDGPEVTVSPLARRAVIFATTDHSYHGHPQPLACPKDVSRRSIALYYYSADRPVAELSPAHSTLYRET